MKWFKYSLRIQVFVGTLLVVICIMALSLTFMYQSAHNAIGENATNYIRESISYADATLSRMINVISP